MEVKEEPGTTDESCDGMLQPSLADNDLFSTAVKQEISSIGKGMKLKIENDISSAWMDDIKPLEEVLNGEDKSLQANCFGNVTNKEEIEDNSLMWSHVNTELQPIEKMYLKQEQGVLSTNQKNISKRATTTKNTINCHICPYKTDKEETLQIHIRTTHLHLGTYKCSICDFSTTVKSELRIHYNGIHLGIKIHECTRCDYKTGFGSCLKRHIANVHKIERKYKCSWCAYKAKSNLSSSVNNHMHMKEKNEQCEFCDYKTKTKSSVRLQVERIHMSDASNDKTRTCELCGYSTSSNAHFKAHVREVHLNLKDFQCEYCGFIAHRMQYLEKHMKKKHLNEWLRSSKVTEGAVVEEEKLINSKLKEKYQLEEAMHQGEEIKECTNETINIKTKKKAESTTPKDLKCHICFYKTNSSETLEFHIKTTHFNFETFKCTSCDFTTPVKAKLRHHYNVVHLGLKIHECSQCAYTTAYKANLTKHIASKHSNERKYQCNWCDYKAKVISGLSHHISYVHKQEKKFECDLCDYKAIKKSSVRYHAERVHKQCDATAVPIDDKMKKCDLCGYTSELIDDLRQHVLDIHGDLKIFNCDYCDFSTHRKCYIEDHFKRKHSNLKNIKVEDILIRYAEKE